MEWTAAQRWGFGAALEEANALGIRLAPDGRSWCDLFVHVCAVSGVGLLDSDPRRIIRLIAPARIAVLLREQTLKPTAHDPHVVNTEYGPPIPLKDLAALEAFFESLTWGEEMYDREFLDGSTNLDEWPSACSLDIRLKSEHPAHTLYWYSECRRREPDDSYLTLFLEGEFTFRDLRVLRADGTDHGVEEFIEDGRRYLEAESDEDLQVLLRCQREAHREMPSWRAWAPGATNVTRPGELPSPAH